MLTTINTDASFHTKFKVGAFAFWCVSDEFKIQKAGFLRDLCKNPDETELKCIVNALKTVLSSNNNIKRIIINTDSLNAIGVLKNDRSHIHKYNLYRWKHLRKMFNTIHHKYEKKNGNYVIPIEFRHVKAHSGVDDKRSYVNEWCDRNAKYYLWKRINELKAKGKIK